jgi:glutaminyl-peptide cyclotransferase
MSGAGDATGVATVEATQTAAAEAFDGARAMEQAERIVGFGPRPVGSDALEQTRLYVEETLQGYGISTRRDELIGDTPHGPIPMANLIAEVPAAPGGEHRPIVILSGHYDTLNMAGVEFVGANDAGSSTAILLELGRVLAEHAPPMPVWLVFFDGEEASVQWGPTDGTYGSRHMAQRISSEGRIRDFGAMILLDMIGDADLVIDTEMNSTGWLNDLIWATAEEIGHGEHFSSDMQFMDDDHRPFMEIGVPSVDLIDFNYGPGHRYWHAPFDTLDKLGVESFQAVGETVLSVLPLLAERFDGGR